MKPVILALLSAAALSADSVSLTYLGTAGWQIESGKTIVLIDPYFTRAKYPSPNDAVSADDPRPLVGVNSVVESDAAAIDAHIKRADLLLLTHTHPDHALDMPYIARKTKARVIGTESTATVARAYGIPESLIQVVRGGETLKFDGVTIHPIRSVHGIFRKPPAGWTPGPPPLVRADVTAPMRFGQFQEGGTLAYLLEMGGHRIIVFGSMNYIESEIAGLRPDIALIGAMPERHNIDDYTARIMKALGNPALVLPTHWDRFNVPHSVSQAPAVARLQSFLDEIKAASPGTKVMVPSYFQAITVP